MQEPNEHGVYAPEASYELARRGRSYAAVEVAQCRDGLFRYGIDFHSSHCGSASPITDGGPGYPTATTARDAAAVRLLDRFPKHRPTDPEVVAIELAELRAQVEQSLRQPSLF